MSNFTLWKGDEFIAMFKTLSDVKWHIKFHRRFTDLHAEFTCIELDENGNGQEVDLDGR